MIRKLLLIFWLALPCLAQFSNITLSGIIVTGTTSNTPGQGEPLGGVEVEVLGTSFVTHSNANGYFAFYDLPDGEYTLITRKEGFPLARTNVRVRFAGGSSQCHVLMNPALAPVVHNTVVPGGAIYVAFSKKYDGVLRRESSPFELLAQKILAAGGKLPGLQREYIATPNSLNNPICSSDNCLMVYPPSQPNKTVFLDLPGEPHWVAFDEKGTFLYVAAGEIPVLQIYNAARDHPPASTAPVEFIMLFPPV